MPSLSRRLVAEAFGTFGLVFFGASAVVMSNAFGNNYGLLGIALTHAIVLSIMVTATMHISGGHLNPAISTGLLVARRIDAVTWISYVIAQLVGAVLAGFCMKWLLPEAAGRALSYGTPLIANSVTFWQATAIEGVITFFLVSSVFGTIVADDAPKVGGFGVGLSLLFIILFAGPLTGGSANPARAFGPALVSGVWTGHLAYWIGPAIGGILAGLFWGYLLLDRSRAEAAA